MTHEDDVAGHAQAALSAIAGAAAADRLIETLRTGQAGPDALLEALEQVLAIGDRDRVRAFARRLAKALEQCA